jgi:hypothetical protein
MRWKIRHIFDRAFSRQTTSLLLLLTVVGALLPVPLIPTASSAAGIAKDRSQAFPCQDRPCGCLSAEQCRKKCCCFNKAQKIAWAKRNGVDVAAVVTITQDEKSQSGKQRDACDAPVKGSCCKSSVTTKAAANSLNDRAQSCLGNLVTRTAIREGEAPAEPLSQCVYLLRRLSRSFALPNAQTSTFAHGDLAAADRSANVRREGTSRCKAVVGIMAQECQGVTTTLIGLPMFVLPADVALEIHCESTCQRFVLSGSRLVCRYTEPPVPPPRQCLT